MSSSQLTTKDEVIAYLCSFSRNRVCGRRFFRNRFMKKRSNCTYLLWRKICNSAYNKKTAKKNGIAVALLRKPVIWDGFEVNIVLMFALHKSFG